MPKLFQFSRSSPKHDKSVFLGCQNANESFKDFRFGEDFCRFWKKVERIGVEILGAPRNLIENLEILLMSEKSRE